ncbi:TonB-dependent receptor plug domain-containing protein [Acetobacter persici]|uniref:TonB-dependent receptor plug domain-containing protein n=1 Tax=Acetobacter persici TaxID=1076596 RepID=UPI001FCC1282|nr:Plug domain-containing protein [Acetobacter persici]
MRPVSYALSLLFGISCVPAAYAATLDPSDPKASAAHPYKKRTVVSPARKVAGPEYITAYGKTAPLQMTPAVGGKLGLSIQHTPGTLNVVSHELMMQRGYAQAEAAADSAPGVSSGGSPGSPAQLMMRGFTGNQILVLHDGQYFGPTTMVNRPQNTFNLESVQVLKGPSSVLYGQGP